MSGSRRTPSLAVLLVTGLVLTWSVLPVAPASAAGVHQVGDGVGVTVARGWSVAQSTASSVTLRHHNPQGEFTVLAAGTVSVTVDTAAGIHLSQYAAGFQLKNLKAGPPQVLTAPGPTFDQVSTIAFSGTHAGAKFAGMAVEYQNSTTGNGAFAVVIAYPSSKAALKKGANAMFNSIVSDT